MLVIGLTGSIASGKSFALQAFAKLRLHTHSADDVVHKILVADAKLKQQIFLRFPDTKDAHNNVIRSKLAQHIYKNSHSRNAQNDNNAQNSNEDSNNLAWLEQLIHPRVSLHRKRYLQHCRIIGARVVVIEIPLLLETALQKEFDYVVMTFAPKFLRRKRAFQRKNMTSLQWRNINQRQMPDCKKKTRCDGVIISGLGKATARRSAIKSLCRFRNARLQKINAKLNSHAVASPARSNRFT